MEDHRLALEDRRAHERIEELNTKVDKHLDDHARFEHTLVEIAGNTKELVELVRGAKGIRTLIIWSAPVIVFFAGVYSWIKSQ